MNDLELAIKAHIENECFAKFLKIKEMNGGTLDLPQNLFNSKEAIKYIYEIDDTINIYANGIKERSIKCVKYAQRPLIAVDIIGKMFKAGLGPELLVVYNDTNKIVELDKIIPSKSASNLLDEPESSKNKILEKELYAALELFFDTQNVELVTEKIEEGFEIVTKNYIGSINET